MFLRLTLAPIVRAVDAIAQAKTTAHISPAIKACLAELKTVLPVSVVTHDGNDPRQFLPNKTPARADEAL